MLKYVVVDAPLNEVDVHPPGSYARLVELSTAAAATLSRDDEVSCPGCQSDNRRAAFEKQGFHYVACRSCASIYVSPRPSAEAVRWYLHESPAAEFRLQEYRHPLSRRDHEEALNRADWVQEMLRAYGRAAEGSVVDVHTRSPEYLKALSDQRLAPVLAVDPLTPLPEPLLEVGIGQRQSLEELPAGSCRMVTAFAALEHAADVGRMIAASHRALTPGGLLALTSRSASGLDIQVLWQDCPTIFPADHLNLLSVEGARGLLQRAGFEILEISTPGQLDVELVERVLNERPDLEAPRFLRYLLTHRDEHTKTGLQQFLQQHLLSSHLRVIARKPANDGHRTIARPGEFP